MFCKWCGGSIASSQTKCNRCGKEVPALSDCGGFYDLVPNAKKLPEIQSGPRVPPVKSMDFSYTAENTMEAEPPANHKKPHKSLLWLAVLMGSGTVVFILMLIFAFSKLNQYATEVNRMRKDLQTIVGEINFIAGENEPGTTEPIVVLNPLLEEQNVSFTVKFNGEDSSQNIEADLDLGDYTDTAVITYSLGEQADAVNSISCILKEADAAVVLTLERNSEFHTQNVAVSYVIDDIAYGSAEAPETCKWQYRIGDDGEWVELPEDVFIRTNETGKTGLSIGKSVLQELIADNKGGLELRCEIFRTNTKSGSLTIVMEGIHFCEEANEEE